MVDVAQLAIRVDTEQVTAATANLDKMSTSAGKAGKSTESLGKSTKKSSKSTDASAKSLGIMGRKAGQASIQFQQLVGQVQGGTNFMTALSMQSADLGIVLGAPLIGAIAGITSGISGPFISALFGATESTEKLLEIVEKLGGSFDEATDGSYKFSQELVRLARISEEAARLKITVDTSDARKSIDSVRDSMADIIGSELLSGFGSGGIAARGFFSDVVSQSIGTVARNTKLARDEIYELAAAFENTRGSTDPDTYNNLASILNKLKTKYGETNESVNSMSAGMSELIETGIDAATVFNRLTSAGDDFDDMLQRSTQNVDDLQTAIPKTSYSLAEWLEEKNNRIRKELQERERLIEAAQTQFSRLVSRDMIAAMSPDQQAAQMLGQTMQQYQQMLDDRLISDEQYLAAKEAAETRYYERIKDLREQDALLQFGLNEATLNGASQLFGNLAEIAKAGGEDSFEAWKRMAQAQALVNVALGVSNALATVPAPLNFAVAGTVAAMGAVQIAQIEQQQYQAREYGGQVKAGSSYLVGERGPEMITMGGNGNVTPAKDVQSANGPTIVLQVSTGVQSTVRAEMASMMPMIAKTVQRVVGAQRR